MKAILTAMAICACAYTSGAQAASGMYAGKWEDNDHARHKAAYVEQNEFTEAEISVADGQVVFTNLPDTKRGYSAVITDGEGEFIKQKKISPSDNRVSTNHMSRGLYFVTIVYKSKGRKTFAMNL